MDPKHSLPILNMINVPTPLSFLFNGLQKDTPFPHTPQKENNVLNVTVGPSPPQKKIAVDAIAIKVPRRTFSGAPRLPQLGSWRQPMFKRKKEMISHDVY